MEKYNFYEFKDEFICVVQTRNNHYEIIDKFSGVCQEDISMYMDYCIDETAIDALVSLGGDPSCFNMISHFNLIDKYRTFTRRLYHGVSEVPMANLENAYLFLTIYTSGMTNEMLIDSCRDKKYDTIENEKFKWWEEKYPNIVLTKKNNNFEHLEGPHDIIYIPRFDRKRIRLTHPKTIGDEYTMKSIWFHLESEFGEYHREKSPKVPKYYY